MSVSCVAVLALAAPSYAVDNGTYVIYAVVPGGCLAPQTEGGFSSVALKRDNCPAWKVANQEYGSVEISPANGPARCLYVRQPFREVLVATCKGVLQWRIEEFAPAPAPEPSPQSTTSRTAASVPSTPER